MEHGVRRHPLPHELCLLTNKFQIISTLERITHVCLLPSWSSLVVALRSTSSRSERSKAPPTASLSLPLLFHEVCCMLIASPASRSCGGRDTSRGRKKYFSPMSSPTGSLKQQLVGFQLTSGLFCSFLSIHSALGFQLIGKTFFFFLSFLPFVEGGKELFFTVKRSLSFPFSRDSHLKCIYPKSSRRQLGKMCPSREKL